MYVGRIAGQLTCTMLYVCIVLYTYDGAVTQFQLALFVLNTVTRPALLCESETHVRIKKISYQSCVYVYVHIICTHKPCKAIHPWL